MTKAPAIRPQTPAVESPATYGIGSDSYAGKVMAVFNRGREIWVEVPRLGVKKFTYRPAASAQNGRPVYRLRGQQHGYLLLGTATDYRSREF